MSESEVFDATRAETLLASSIIFIIALCGIVFNLTGILVVLRNPILKNSFGAMCFSHSIANLGVLMVFFLWAAPTTYIQSESYKTPINKILGQINILFWDACVYSHLSVSFNRYMSIAQPLRANLLFTRNNTLLLIGSVWFIALCHVFPYFWYDSCYVYYSPVTWTWNFASSECGYVISTYTDYYTSVACFLVIVIVDFSTLVLLISHRKSIIITGEHHRASYHRRRHIEVRFFIQSCLQGSLFFYELFNFYYISTFMTSRWAIFFTSTFAWELCHCLDGFVVCLFHFRWKYLLPYDSCTQMTRVTADQLSSAHNAFHTHSKY